MKHLALAALGLLLAASLVPHARAIQDPVPDAAPGRWEYKVVGLDELHDSTLEHLKEAIKQGGGLLDRAKAPLDGLAEKSEAMLNELGAEGWDLVHYSNTSMVLKRPVR